MKRNLYNEIICGILILLFAYTAFSKSFEYNKFASFLKTPPLGFNKGAATIAWLLPAAEFTVVLLLLFPRTRKTGLYGSLSLLSVFTFYLGYMILFSKKLPCHCGGVINAMSWQQHVLFNLFFIAINVAGIMNYKKRYVYHAAPSPPAAGDSAEK